MIQNDLMENLTNFVRYLKSTESPILTHPNFSEPGNETDTAKLQDFQYCIWCAHMIKVGS